MRRFTFQKVLGLHIHFWIYNIIERSFDARVRCSLNIIKINCSTTSVKRKKMIDNSEILLGIIALLFAAVVVYFAFKSEGKKNNELMNEIKSIKELLEQIKNKMNKS